METKLAAAYWGPRMESAVECARRASAFVEDLSNLSEFFRGWRLPARSRAEATRNQPFSSDVSSLEALFLKGTNRRDIDGELIEELGFRISAWNGMGGEETSSLAMKCGMYSNVPGVSNAIVLKIPAKFDVDSDGTAELVVDLLVRAWNPDWAVVASQASMIERADKEGPFLDRALYLSSPFKCMGSVFTGAKQSPLNDGVILVPQ